MRNLLFAALLALAACKGSPPPYMAPEPDMNDKPAFYTFLLKTMPQTLEEVTCHCCGKSLGKCYGDMFDPHATAKCPFG